MILRSKDKSTLALFLLASFGTVRLALAKEIGTNKSAESITRERIAKLPSAERVAWLSYLEQSRRQSQTDKSVFQAELKRAGTATPTDPPHGYGARSIPLNRD